MKFFSAASSSSSRVSGMGQVLSVPERCVCPSSAQNGAMAGSVDLCVGSHIDAFSGSRDPVYGVCDLLQSWNGNVRKAAAFNCKRAKLHVQPLRRVRLRKNYRRTTSRTELLRAGLRCNDRGAHA